MGGELDSPVNSPLLTSSVLPAQRQEVEFHQLNWKAIRDSAEAVLTDPSCDEFERTTYLPVDVRQHALRNLVVAAFELGDYAAAKQVLQRWSPPAFPLPSTAAIQDRFARLGDLLMRIHVLARAGDPGTARAELTAVWPEVDAVFAAGPEHLFNQVQTARALSIRAEVEDAGAGLKREWLERAAGYLRPASVAGRLTRYEREILLGRVEKQLAGMARGS